MSIAPTNQQFGVAQSPEISKKQVLDAYRTAFWSNTTDIHALLTLADSYNSIQEFDEAIALYQKAIEQDASLLDAHAGLAFAYRAAGRLTDAVVKFADTSKMDPQDPYDLGHLVEEIAWDISDTKEAIATLQSIVSKYPDDYWFKRALATFCYNANMLAETEQLHQELLAIAPSDRDRADVHIWWGLLLSNNGDYRGAATHLEHARSWSREEFDTCGLELEDQLANAYLRSGQPDLALAFYVGQIRTLRPGIQRAEALMQVARCYEALRDYVAAVEALIEILTFVKDSPSDDLTAKERTIEDPLFFESLYAALTRCYEAKGDFVRAREAFQMEKKYHTRAVARTT